MHNRINIFWNKQYREAYILLYLFIAAVVFKCVNEICKKKFSKNDTTSAKKINQKCLLTFKNTV